MDIELRTDLTHDLLIGSELVEISGGCLSVSSEKKMLFKEKLGDIEHAEIEEGMGLGKLKVWVRNRGEEEIAYFTKKKSGNFGKLAGVLNNYSKSKVLVRPDFLPEDKFANQKSTLLWLYNFSKNYRKPLITGIILAVIMTALSLVPPYLLKVLIDNVLTTSTHSIALFEDLTIVLFLSYLGIAIVTVLENYILNVTGQKIVNDLRSRTFKHVLNLSQSFIDRFPTGRVLSRLTGDAGNTNWLMTWAMPTVLTNSLTIIGTAIILFGMYPGLAVYVLIPVPFALYAIFVYKTKSQRMYHKRWRKSADVTASIADVVPNYAVIKASAKEDFEGKKIDRLLDELYSSFEGVTRANQTYWPAIGFITTLATILIWWQGGNLVIAGTIQLGVITAFVAYTALLYGPVNNLGNIIPFIQQGLTSGDRLREILETEIEVKEIERPKKPSLAGNIEFEHVNFGYAPYSPLLEDFSLSLKKGERVAIVGRSGSGKSTFSKLLLRFYDANSGTIKINGTDIKDIDLHYMRAKMAYVPQDVSLFEGSVEYNIRYGSAYEDESTKNVIIAAKVADIHDEMMMLNLAYDTFLGERGMSLSGGQRQKIAIARAMIKNPDIVILDECTSNLDAISENAVYQAITNLTKGKTTIYITHNPNEVVSMDRVLVMKEGRIVEQGTSKKLLLQKGEFYSMFKSHNKNLRALKIKEVHAKIDYSKNFAKGKVIAHRDSTDSTISLVANGKRYFGLKPRLAFPITNENFVVFYGRNGKEQLIVEDSTKIEGERKAFEIALMKNNLRFKVHTIYNIQITGDELRWDVMTDRGRAKIHTSGRINVIPRKNKIQIIDVYGTIYEAELATLDKNSMQIINETI